MRVTSSRTSHKVVALIMTIFGILMSNDAMGGRYELLKRYPTGVHDQMWEVSQDDMDVCRAYEKNLNSFPEIKYPMVCERPINPRFPEFSRLQWTSLNVPKYKNMIRKIDQQSIYYQTHPDAINRDKWEKEFESGLNDGRIKLRLARVAIDQVDSKPLSGPLYILEYDTGRRCNPASPRSLEFSGGYTYFTTNEELSEVTKIKGPGSSLSDVFIYKNELFFDSFSYTEWSDGYKQRLKTKQYEVWLYKLVAPLGDFAHVPICRFRYIGRVLVSQKEEH